MYPDRNIPTTVIHEPEAAINFSEFSEFSSFPGSLQISKIKLLQQPSELLDINLSFWNDVKQKGSGKCSCSLLVHFHNVISNYTYDYNYEIICRAHTSEVDHYHQQLFTYIYKNTQTTKPFNSERITICSPTFPVSHFWFSIRRFKSDSTSKCVTANNADHQDNVSSNLGVLLLENSFYSDIVLQVGEREFKAHKHILAAISPVFKAMFQHEMSEQKAGVVEIVDIEPSVVAEMLSYIYTGKTDNISHMSLQLFKAAHKYELHGLLSICEEFLAFGITLSNAVEILDLVKVYELPKLQTLVETFVRCRECMMVNEISYREYLKRELNHTTLIHTLKLCAKYAMLDVKNRAFEFIKSHAQELAENKQFLALFNSHLFLMKDIFISICKDFQLNEKTKT